MKRSTLLALALVCLFADSAHAQDTPNPFFASKVLYADAERPERKLSLDYGDAVYWSGAISVIQSSRHKYELNPLFRGKEGEFATGRAVAVTSLTWGAFKFLEYKYPKHRRLLFWGKIGAGALHFAFVPNNRGVK